VHRVGYLINGMYRSQNFLSFGRHAVVAMRRVVMRPTAPFAHRKHIAEAGRGAESEALPHACGRILEAVYE